MSIVCFILIQNKVMSTLCNGALNNLMYVSLIEDNNLCRPRKSLKWAKQLLFISSLLLLTQLVRLGFSAGVIYKTKHYSDTHWIYLMPAYSYNTD